MVHVDAGDAPTRFVAGAEGLSWSAGPAPADPGLYRGPEGAADMAVRVFHRDGPDELMPMIASDARLIVWPGAGAETANMNYVRMQPGEENVPHVHHDSEDTIFVLEGARHDRGPRQRQGARVRGRPGDPRAAGRRAPGARRPRRRGRQRRRPLPGRPRAPAQAIGLWPRPERPRMARVAIGLAQMTGEPYEPSAQPGAQR